MTPSPWGECPLWRDILPAPPAPPPGEALPSLDTKGPLPPGEGEGAPCHALGNVTGASSAPELIRRG